MLQYPSHRPVPRMVLASTLEKLSDNPRYLAAVLLDSSRPWNDRLDELHDAGIPVSRTRARNLASCMRRFGVRTSGASCRMPTLTRTARNRNRHFSPTPIWSTPPDGIPTDSRWPAGSLDI